MSGSLCVTACCSLLHFFQSQFLWEFQVLVGGSKCATLSQQHPIFSRNILVFKMAVQDSAAFPCNCQDLSLLESPVRCCEIPSGLKQNPAQVPHRWKSHRFNAKTKR